ncbi:hypothetical protein FRACYDRAFT_194160 [Fragilariopsis cylindrus CCMP1102]|uniref:Translation initiation factor eIF2B subunit epsilon n=1 Tax=Fragilariopsis cylindrus CCMP1102 TaxID=635003 RepID=A0A1E7EWC3_9STRA|nr:hypothetical protein FRACYDRAFT_194160 [Fragilariopsis cylindrus CCMP1102]|eukprot:OEU10261.1 hypothetical protein FRACYDRAFT_194160 [Fragilariopsis cylindrus CCMP1102]
MPSNNNKKKSNADDDDDLKQEGQQKLQAVLLADAVFGSKVTGGADGDQSFGLRPWSSDVSTSSQILCPINNIPLIDYILDFLSSNGIEQVIIVIGTCAGSDDALEDYLMNNQKRHNFELIFLKDTSLTNAGDALRELYKRSWIRPSKQALPFLLVSGDVIADIDLREAMKAHKQRHSHDSAALMTIVLKPVQSHTTTTSSLLDNKSCSASNSSSNNNIDENNDYRVMMYDNRSSQKSGVTLPCTFLTQSQSSTGTGTGGDGGLVVRTDLMDTGIAICSPDVLGRLEDEFDYLDIAHDFVTNSVAEEEDGLQTRVYAHVLENNGGTDCSNTRNYAARAVDFQTYHAISKDLLKRWAYPTVADRMVTTTTRNEDGSNNNNEDRLYKLARVYKEMLHPTKVGRTSIVHGPGMMGSHGTIGEDCVVIRCVLGDNIQIDNNSSLEDCHLMDGVVVEAYVNMDSCLIARNATIKEGATLGKGCVIGEGCVVGKGSKLPPFTRITLAKDDDDDGLWGDDEGYGDSSNDDDSTTDVEKSKDNDSGDENDHNVVGRDGIGRVWRPSLDDDGYDDDDDDDDQNPFENLMNLQSIGGDPTSYYLKREQRLIAKEEEEYESDGFSDHDEDDDDDDMMMAETQAFSKFTEGTVTFGHEDDDINNNFGSTTATATAPDVIGRQKGVDVIKEMTDICMEFDDEFHPFENLAIELNSFKFSQNATYGDCVTAAMSSLLCKMKLSTDMTDGRLVSLLKTKLDKFWTGMLQRLCVGIPEELSILYALENAATVDQTATSKASSTGDNEEATENQTITTNIAQKLRSGMSFRFVLQTLHSQEVLSEEAILLWAEEHREDNIDDDPRSKLFMMQSVQDFLEWLEQESEDEDDSDDNSDGEDSDED